MRDAIKDEEYFEKYLSYLNKRIEEFEQLLKQVIEEKGESFEGVKNGYLALQIYYSDKIKLLYSSGADMKKIKNIYPRYMYCFIKSWIEDYGFEVVMNVFSLGVLVNIEKDYFVMLENFIKKKKAEDYLVDFMINSVDSSWGIKTDAVKYPEAYGGLKKIIESDNPIVELKEYLTKWYGLNSDAAWYDSHKSDQDIYTGYWCFEAGAIAKILEIDDEELKDAKYYPYDLVHFEG